VQLWELGWSRSGLGLLILGVLDSSEITTFIFVYSQSLIHTNLVLYSPNIMYKWFLAFVDISSGF
jgi:hypothetical protein